MTWRKWVVRGLVYSVLAALTLLGLVYYLYTNPTATRNTVLAKLAEKFPGAVASLQSARLNLLDGISLCELRMNRRDDLDKTAARRQVGAAQDGPQSAPVARPPRSARPL
jgi:hypothetical protein